MDIAQQHWRCETDFSTEGKARLYADERRGAQYSKVDVGDTVLIQQDKVDKFTTPFKAPPHKVVVESPIRLTRQVVRQLLSQR